MSMAFGSKLQLQPGSWSELIYDICIGAAVGARHSFYMVTRWWYERLLQPILHVVYDDDLFNNNKNNDEPKSLKVVAVGYGRTGTVSSFFSFAMFPWWSCAIPSCIFCIESFCSRVLYFGNIPIYVKVLLAVAFLRMFPLWDVTRYSLHIGWYRARLLDVLYYGANAFAVMSLVHGLTVFDFFIRQPGIFPPIPARPYSPLLSIF